MREQTKSTVILVLAAGEFPSPANDRDDYPVCLSDVDDRPLLEHIIERAATLPDARFIYAMRENEVRKYHLDSVVELLTPGATVIRVPEGTRGAACTALLAACDVDAGAELLVIGANALVTADLDDVVGRFREGGLDAGVLVFRSIQPRYSYVRLDEQDRVTEATYRKPISHHAAAGIFWFRDASAFLHAVKTMIRKDSHVDGVFSIAPALNEMILKHASIGAFRLPSSAYMPIKAEGQSPTYEDGLAARAR